MCGGAGGRDVRKREPDEKKRKPEALANVLGAFLKDAKLEERVEAAQVVPEWESLVGKQIATVTKPISVTPDGTLFVSVKTNGWMTELSLMEPQLLRALNAKAGRTMIRKIAKLCATRLPLLCPRRGRPRVPHIFECAAVGQGESRTSAVSRIAKNQRCPYGEVKPGVWNADLVTG